MIKSTYNQLISKKLATLPSKFETNPNVLNPLINSNKISKVTMRYIIIQNLIIFSSEYFFSKFIFLNSIIIKKIKKNLRNLGKELLKSLLKKRFKNRHIKKKNIK